MTTFTILWVDDTSNAVCVHFSTDPKQTSWLVPVDKSNPDTWVATISDWYAANLAPVPPNDLVGKSIAIQ